MQHDKISWGIFAGISRGNRVLIKRRSDGTWDLPGGGQEPGEHSPIITLSREVREEVGMGVLSVNGMIGTYLPFHNPTRDKIDIACIYDVTASGDPKISDEATDHYWVDLETAMQWIANGNVSLGNIVGPQGRVGRTPRMILDAATVLGEPDKQVFAHERGPSNLELPTSRGYQLSRDGLWLVKNNELGFVKAWNRRDPFQDDGLLKSA